MFYLFKLLSELYRSYKILPLTIICHLLSYNSKSFEYYFLVVMLIFSNNVNKNANSSCFHLENSDK